MIETGSLDNGFPSQKSEGPVHFGSRKDDFFQAWWHILCSKLLAPGSCGAEYVQRFPKFHLREKHVLLYHANSENWAGLHSVSILNRFSIFGSNSHRMLRTFSTDRTRSRIDQTASLYNAFACWVRMVCHTNGLSLRAEDNDFCICSSRSGGRLRKNTTWCPVFTWNWTKTVTWSQI